MLDALVDTLMALWNATWREKVVPVFFAFLVVGLSTFLFLVQIGLPTFSRLSSASGHNSLSTESGKSVNLAINPHVTGSVQAIVVPTPAQTSAAKKSLTPIPAPTQASDTTDPPTPMPAPDIVSVPGFDSSASIGTIGIASSIDTIPAKSRTHAPARHNGPPRPTVASAPSVVATATATSPATTTTSGTITPTLPSAPTAAATPTSPPTPLVGATPTVAIPTNAPIPTTPAPIYPATPISESDPANTVTVSPAIVPTKVGELQTATTASPTPTINSANVIAPTG